MASIAKKVLQDANIIDAKKGSDTIRLRESYRDQATLWRALTLIQIPTTLIALLLAMVLWFNREVILNVPEKPLPGMYAAQQIPDTEFINTTTNFINLIASYQPAIARRQYGEARKMLTEPMLSRFDREMIETELKTIERTKRTQIFFVDPTKTAITRADRSVTISMTGERLKIISGRELPMIATTYEVTMGLLPRNSLNPYGIVVTNVKVFRTND